VNAVDMQRLLQPLVSPQGILYVDATRNMLIIEGTAQERSSLIETIALFDVDWLSGMSFALYTPKFTNADNLAQELGSVMGGAGSPLAGIVRLVPIQRLNAVLAISPQLHYLEELAQWVDRLDRPGEGSDKRIFVYRAQNGRAGDLAAVLGRILS